MHSNEEEPPLAPTREKPVCSNEDPAQWINKEKKPGILFPTTTISNLLLDNFLQPKIWSIWHRHNISHRPTNNRQQQKNFLEPTTSGCCFILLCRKIPWKNDEIILSLPFFTTHSLWNPHQWGGHLPVYHKHFPWGHQWSPVAKPRSSSQFLSNSTHEQPLTGFITTSFSSPLASKTTCSSALGGPRSWVQLLDTPFHSSTVWSLRPLASDLFLLYSCPLGARFLALTIIFYSEDSPVHISAPTSPINFSCCVPFIHACSVAQPCPTLCDPMNCSLPGSSVHGIFRHEYWSGLWFPTLGDLPNLWIKPLSRQLSPLHIL